MATDEIDWHALRILIVDDKQESRARIAGMLRALGVGSTPMAKNVEDALADLQNSAVDLVVTKRDMPEMDGIALVHKVRHPNETPARNIPVIMVHSEGSVKLVIHAIKQGVDHFMVLPLSAKDLALSIENLIVNPAERITTGTYVGPCRRRLPEKIYGPYEGPDRREE